MDEIEVMIQAQNNPAPRVTPEDIEATIAAEYIVNGAKAIGDAPASKELELLTLCFLVLKNGFTVVGTSACVHPSRFNAEIGAKLARQKAIDQIWPLEGYRLASSLRP